MKYTLLIAAFAIMLAACSEQSDQHVEVTKNDEQLKELAVEVEAIEISLSKVKELDRRIEEELNDQ
jgi:PBP1b-binding outer membrane lipoprotein LpoB